MVGQPDRDFSARREEALARIAAVTEALNGLEETLRAEPGLPAGAAQALLAGARALCPVAMSIGTELAVSAGPDHGWTVFVTGDATGPRLRVRRLRLDTPTDDVAAQLAALLRPGNGAAR